MTDESSPINSLSTSKHWFAGPATIEDDWVVLDLDSAVHCWPRSNDTEMMLSLANIRRPEDVLDFVGTYGLLRTPPGEDSFREPLTHWLETAQQLSSVLGYATLVRRGSDPLNDGAADALVALRRLLSDEIEDAQDLRDNNALLLERYSNVVTLFLNKRLGSLKVGVADMAYVDGSTWGSFTVGVQGPDVETLAFYRAASLLAVGEELRQCENCGKSFVPADRRQIFHDKQCATHARQKRFRSKLKSAT